MPSTVVRLRVSIAGGQQWETGDAIRQSVTRGLQAMDAAFVGQAACNVFALAPDDVDLSAVQGAKIEIIRAGDRHELFRVLSVVEQPAGAIWRLVGGDEGQAT